MRTSLGRAVVALSLVAAGVAVGAPPAHAAAGVTILDASGVDFDAACADPKPLPPPPANGYASPFGVGCPDASTYDGATESTDLRTVKLDTLSKQFVAGGPSHQTLRATVVVDGAVPAAGNPALGALDGPNPAVTEASYKVMFQNRDKQHNGDNHGSGCNRVGTGRVRDQHGHWRDGHHFFVGLTVRWDGTKWTHRIEVGEYDPRPDGGFLVLPIGTNAGPAPVTLDPWMTDRWSYSLAAGPGPGQTTITVDVTGQVRVANVLCTTGYWVGDYASTTPGYYSAPGFVADRILNVKGLSAVAGGVASAETMRSYRMACDRASDFCDERVPEGTISFSDTTAGFSTAGQVLGNPSAPPVNTPGIAYSDGGQPGTPDNLGRRHLCPWPTFGGWLPDNPLWVGASSASGGDGVPCELDDDLSAPGSLYPEFWDTVSDFTANFA